ncbi:hypothetical protein ACFWTC_37190 [Streptomyces sp. NPDC058619]|uniref:hypothetical protein n=1 Tax=unclassified Streptomyces TaxID=2593676 RepID=UPI00365DBA32
MRRLRVLVVPVLPLALLAIVGCSGARGASVRDAGPTASSASPSVSRSPSPSASPSLIPITPRSPAPTLTPPPCVPLAQLGDLAQAAYFQALGPTEFDLRTSGVKFEPPEDERPCEGVAFKVVHYWVDTRAYVVERVASYQFEYDRAGAPASVVAGPPSGWVPGTAPPDPSKCTGTLSVAYVGKDITADELPDELQLPPKAGSRVIGDVKELKIDNPRAVGVLFVPPSAVETCL